MAEWSPESAQAAKEALAGGFGAMLQVYLRHPGSVVRVLIHVVIGIGLAWAFTGFVADLFGFPAIPVAVVIGLVGKALAESALKSAEKVEIKAVLGLDRKDGK
jgi:hypothetical protein